MKMPKWWWAAVALVAVLWINVVAINPTPSQAPPTEHDPVETIRAQFHDMGMDTVDLEIIEVPMPTREEIIEAVPDAAHVWGSSLEPSPQWNNTPCDNGAVMIVGVCNSQSSSTERIFVDVWVHEKKGTTQ